MKIEPIKPHVGTRIYVDRASLCDAAVVAKCLELLEERGVLVFPRIGLSDKEQLSFTDCLGMQGEGTRHFPGADAVGENIFELKLRPENKTQFEYVKASFFWHIDGLHSDNPVPKGTLLCARRVAKKGGQTEFANTVAAYEALTSDEKAEIADLRALHTPIAILRWVFDSQATRDLVELTRDFPAKERPIVQTHRSGRKSMTIGAGADYIVGMPVPDGRALLSRLLEWTVQPDFKYRHQWEEGDLVVWDNQTTLHRAIPYDPSSGRAMRRTSFEARAR